ncbi:MAG: DNA-protecting protein DprA [Candidatus Dadabacteria bacterium]|nr:MAG: DNA-protecting protein DprA [Candidatus Dadabacteria bacterium]
MRGKGLPDDPAVRALRLFSAQGVGPRGVARVRERWTFDALAGARDDTLDPIERRVRDALLRPVRGENRQIATWRERYHLLTPEHPDWPQRLQRLPDPPVWLFVDGRLPTFDLPSVVIVGTRRPSAYGRSIASTLARDLADAGVTIGSGLAYGIDAAAHQGSLAASRGGFAVVAHGLDMTAPQRNAALRAAMVAAEGGILTEYPPEQAPDVHQFPARNRLLAALADAVVVVEGARRSGSLITAELALDIGVDVLAVPGRVGDAMAEGPLGLLRKGCAPAVCADDILAAVGWVRRALVDASSVPEYGRAIWEALPPHGALHLDELSERTGRSVEALLPDLLQLELSGWIDAQPGQYYGRAAPVR